MRRASFASCVVGLAVWSMTASSSFAQANAAPVRIGVLTDLSGYLSSALGTPTIDAARMAAEDFGGRVLERPIEVLGGDHQNKPDVGAAIARRWIDQDNVQVFTGMGNSSVALAVHALVREHQRIALYASAATPAITGRSVRRTGFTGRTIRSCSVTPYRPAF